MRASDGRSKGREQGFTLIEVIATIAIVGVVMGAALATVRYTLIARNMVDNWSESEKEGPVILDLIEEDLTGILTFNVNHEHVFQGRDHGQADLVDFVTHQDMTFLPQNPAHPLPGPVDYNEVGYRCRTNVRNTRFIELWRREDLGLDSEPFSGGSFQLLSKRVLAFDVTYFKKAGEYAEEFFEWPPDDLTYGLPYRMRIRLTLEITVQNVPGDRVPRRQTYVRNIIFPKEIRWAMKRRAQPYIPERGGAQPGAAPGQAGEAGTEPTIPGAAGGGRGVGGGGGTGGFKLPPGGAGGGGRTITTTGSGRGGQRGNQGGQRNQGGGGLR